MKKNRKNLLSHSCHWKGACSTGDPAGNKKGRICLAVLVCMMFILSAPVSAAGEGNAKVVFTQEEQEYIEQKEELVIGCPVNNNPVLYQDETTGEIKGITVAILDKVADAVGLKFRYKALPSGMVTYDMLKDLNVELMAGVEYNYINRGAKGIAITNPYLPADKIFVCQKGDVFNPEEHMTIAIVSGSETIERVIQTYYPNMEIEFFDDTEKALDAVADGRVDALLRNQYCVERVLVRPKYNNLQIVASASIGDLHCLAALVQVDENGKNIVDQSTRRLISILNKGIAAIDDDEVEFTIIKEMAENAYTLTIGDVLYQYRYPFVVIAIGGCIIIFLIWRNNDLVRKEERAKELEILNGRLHEQQIRLKEALEKEEQAGNAKSRFLSNMSHDIRTPLNAVIGFTGIAKAHLDDRERVEDCLGKIESASNHLLLLINDVLDMASIKSGKIEIRAQESNLEEIMQELMGVIQSQAGAKNIELSLDMQIENKAVLVDTLNLNRILMNIVGNSVKFTEPGGSIRIFVVQKESDISDHADYVFSIKDTGAGISKEFLPHIFDEFEREKNTTISKKEGTGLGLAIVKNLVTMMNGTIEIASEEGKGTEVTVRVPLMVMDSNPRLAAEHEQPSKTGRILSPELFSGRRLLLAEDNELNREIAVEILQTAGFLVETAEDGTIAVEKVEKSAPGYYDAVLMDIQMPLMNGYEASGRIRSLSDRELAAIPVIAMTANAFEEDRQAALQAGMDAHIAKPINVQELLEVLAEAIFTDREIARGL